MTLKRNEILTGVLVVVSLAVVVAVVIALGTPGFLRSLNTYYIFFDNASGIQTGTDVFLAGRRIGEVVDLESPVPVAKRPADHQDLEVRIKIRVDNDAKIFRNVTVRMQQYGWFGQQMIDFVKGDEQSGLAQSETTFVGARVAGVTDLSEKATTTIEEMTAVLVNIKNLTAENGDLKKTVANAKEFTETIKREPWRLLRKGKKK